MKNETLKSQDIVILLKLICVRGSSMPKQADLAEQLAMSQSEISASLKRLDSANLISNSRTAKKNEAKELLIYGVKYVFHTRPGELSRGTPTAGSHPKIAHHFHSNENFVWPNPTGNLRGQSIAPLYRSVPNAALLDSALHYTLALVDLIRIGNKRENAFAVTEIQKMLA